MAGADGMRATLGERPTKSPPENKFTRMLELRDAMREYRKGKPIAFQSRTRP